MNKIRLLLADDHAVLRAGLRVLLNAQPDMEVVGEAGDGHEAVYKARELKPDIILLDITMPGKGGLEVIAEIIEENPGIKVLVLTMHDDESYLKKVLKSGASGYVLKKVADTELLSAIRSIARGEMFLDSSMARVLVSELFSKTSVTAENESVPLTEREKEVLRLIALGYTNQEIATHLVLSIKTVETHKARIMDKLGLRKRSELVRYALKKGIITQENER